MQGMGALSSAQTDLLNLLDIGALDDAEKLSKQLSGDELFALVVSLHETSRYRSTNLAKQQLPKLQLGSVVKSAENHGEGIGSGEVPQDAAASQQGGSITLIATWASISTETPRLDFCAPSGSTDIVQSAQPKQQAASSSQSLAKQSLIQRVAAAGGYNAKASLDLQVGDSVADFDLIASRIGGFGAGKASLLGQSSDGQANPGEHSAVDSAADGHGVSTHQPGAVLSSTADVVPAAASSSPLTAAAISAAGGGLPFGSSVASEDIELSIPSCSSSPREAPSSTKEAAEQQSPVALRQSAADMRASALAGPMSIKLDDVRDGSDDAASEPATPGSNVVTQFTTCTSAPIVTPISVGTPSSMLSTPSTIGSSVSQHVPAETPTAGHKGGGGFGRVLFAPVNALRKSFTGKRVPSKLAAGGTSAVRTVAHSSNHSAPLGTVQSRLPSFTATAGAQPSSSKAGGSKGTPSSSYRPPSVVSNASSRATSTAAAAAAARARSPLGKGPDRLASAPSAASLGARTASGNGGRAAARSPISAGTPAAYRTASTPTAVRPDSSSSVSAGLAWLQQHGDASPSPAVQASRTPIAGRTANRTPGHSPAAEAAAALAGAARLKSMPSTPASSRPGTSHSVRSAASSAQPAPRIGSGASAAGAGSSKIPGFSVTQQMVVSKQQSSKPLSSRTAPTGSARSATSAATTSSAASYMRQISGAGAPAAGTGRTGSRLPSFGGGDSRQQQTPLSSAGTSSRVDAGAAAATARRIGSKCDAVLGQASSSRIGSGALSGAVRGGAASGASQLRRSRSFGSIGELQQQNGHRDVSQIRQMWKKLEQQHGQQQGSSSSRLQGAAQPGRGLTSAAGPVQQRTLSRVPTVGIPQHAAGIPEPEECESPTVLRQQRRSSSSSGHDTSTGGAGAGYVPASDLLGRIDDILEKARTPADKQLHAQLHTAPASAPPAAGYSPAAGPGSLAGKLAGKGPAAAAPRAASPYAAASPLVHYSSSGTPDSGTGKQSTASSQASHTPAGVACFGVQPNSIPTDSSSAGRDQQLKLLQAGLDADSINRQLF